MTRRKFSSGTATLFLFLMLSAITASAADVSVAIISPPIKLEWLAQNPSGKSWWKGYPYASFRVSRQTVDPARTYEKKVMLSTGSATHYHNTSASPTFPKFSEEFYDIPVFNENVVQLACINARPKYDPQKPAASFKYNTTVLNDQNIKITTGYYDATGNFRWETIVVPVSASVTCEWEANPTANPASATTTSTTNNTVFTRPNATSSGTGPTIKGITRPLPK